MHPGPLDARLTHYRLERLLGTGGMGAVYLARDTALDRPVAIKFIAPERAADAVARKRLLREAQTAAALVHPNICGVHEIVDPPDGPMYIVMQYVEGETVAEVLRRGALDARQAVKVAADVASALVAAHRHGIVHRDLKPQNIIITPAGHAILLDFGLARANDAAAAAAAEGTTATGLTAEGALIGTPAYMSPEQVRQAPLDERSDLFSLGAVFYECLTGRRAFTAPTSIELAAEVLHHDPPDVSALRPGLTPQHDDLCRRLLAKHPDDRPRSAEEVLGALGMLSADSSRQGSLSGTARRAMSASHFARRHVAAVLLLTLAVLAAVASVVVWRFRSGSALPGEPAGQWYRKGTEFVRDGAYHSGRMALNEAIKAAPDFAPAYVRLADAETELDETENAQRALLKVNSLVPRESDLPADDRIRFRAVRALMLRDVDRAVEAYGELTRQRPRDAGAWLDLGRAQEAAALNADAGVSYETAVRLDPQYAAARLRSASILGLEGRKDEALRAFAEAERLYKAAANVEGEIESLIRSGAFMYGLGDLKGSRTALMRALDLAGSLQSRAQGIRAQLQLSSVTAAEGKWSDAETMAAAAVESGFREHLEAVAAEGLIELAQILQRQGRTTEADAHLVRAIDLATGRRAERITARATLSRASLMLQRGQAAQAIDTAKAPLAFFQAKRYRRFELTALQITSRAYEMTGNFTEAKGMAEQALRSATALKDDVQAAEALENLAGQANATGALAAALEYRTRGSEIHRRQNDLATLPFDLNNRADLLIRLGRFDEAATLLDEVDAGIAKKLDAFLPRARRTSVLRAMSAAIRDRPEDVARYARDFPPGPDGKADGNSQLAGLLLRYSEARRAAPAPAGPERPLAGSPGSATGRELRYWDLAGRLAREEWRATVMAAEETLSAAGASVSYEFEWRMAAAGAVAARQLGDKSRGDVLGERARQALQRLRTEWRTDVDTYLARPDLAALARRASLDR
jgi:tetratricopeptide (TPR) repeat protein